MLYRNRFRQARQSDVISDQINWTYLKTFWFRIDPATLPQSKKGGKIAVQFTPESFTVGKIFRVWTDGTETE